MLEFKSQIQAIEQLKQYAEMDKHSLLIDGASGSGKTYLSSYFKDLIHADDYVIVQPNVNDIRAATEACSKLNTKIVLCIENLDTGVAGASHALLKFLEEPTSNVYIVVTCIEIANIPDTILSRSIQISLNPPTQSDIEMYANYIDEVKYFDLSKRFKNIIRSFSDVDKVFKLSAEQQEYLNSIELGWFDNPVNDVVWKLSKYPDNTSIDLTLVLRICLNIVPGKYLRKVCIDCLNELHKNRVSSNAIMSKLVMEVKYGG